MVCELAVAVAVPGRYSRAVEAPEAVEPGAAVQLPGEVVEVQKEAQRAVAQKTLGPVKVTWLH